MWAHHEAERLYPMKKLGVKGDTDAYRKAEADRHALYESRRKIALGIVAKRHGIDEDTLAKIDEEGGHKKWQVSETPVLFDPADGDRAVMAPKLGIDPNDEAAVKTAMERQKTIDHRKQKRSGRSQ